MFEFEFGDDIILDGYRIPWLIWIQILIMLLLTLTILLSFFGFFALDSSSNTDTFSLITSSHLGSSSNCSKYTQVAGNRDFLEVDSTTGNRIRIVENNAERDDSSMKAVASTSNPERLFHPCFYFDLAKQAFLKCLGLGSRSPKSPDKEHEHED